MRYSEIHVVGMIVRTAGDHHLRAALANNAERLADRHRARRAAIRVRRAVAARAPGYGNVAVGRAAEDLQRERGGDGAIAFLDKFRVRKFRRGDPAEGRAEADADIGARIFRRELQPGVVERLLRQDEGELRVAVDPLQLMRRENLRRVEIVDHTRALRVVVGRVEMLDETDARFLGQDTVPKSLTPMTNARDGPNSGDNDAMTHEAGRLSTRRFNPARVRVAM